jgi:cytochrome c oxidase cbb3-type subunit 3
MTRTAAVALACVAVAVAGCRREQRQLREPAAASTRDTPVRLARLQPGQPIPTPAIQGAYEDNAYGISEGQRLYNWYNCSGCHFQGGGGIGPALMDDFWIYGSEPAQIYETIAEGRPNGMPSFGGHIPSYQIWQLVAYVRSLAKLQRPDAVAPRADHLPPQSADQRGSAGGKTRAQ